MSGKNYCETLPALGNKEGWAEYRNQRKDEIGKVTEWETKALAAGEAAEQVEQVIREGVGKWMWYELVVRCVAFVCRKLR